MSGEDTRDKLVALIEPLIESKGFEMIDLNYYFGHQGKVFICIDAESGITINDCEEVSRAISELLDNYDPLPHAYILEVSSPGLERPLNTKQHFIRFKGEMIKVTTTEAVAGNIKFAGKLKEASQNSISIESDQGVVTKINYEQIKKAHLWYIKPGNGIQKRK
jgi:ribosome maturation factor RimP